MTIGFAKYTTEKYIIPEDAWSDRLAKISFWSLNLGLAWMVFATLFLLGVLQLYHSVSVGYFDARSLTYLTNRTNTFLEWLRLPGDAVFIVGGALPVLYMAWLGVSRQKPHADMEPARSVLLTDVAEAAGPQA
jgi:nitric oxide reductase subunit B